MTLWIAGILLCGLPLGERGDPLRDCFEAIARGVGEQPLPIVLTEGSCGVLELGYSESLVPVLTSEAGAFVAASALGEGRLVAFGGQDFLSGDADSTFIGIAGNDALVRNAVRWTSGRTRNRAPRVLVDNRSVADLLEDGGWSDVRVASVTSKRGAHGPIEARDWSAAALAEVDVAVVLTNEWDCTHVESDAIVSLRAFVVRGGGLLIAGSSYHWAGDDPEFPANPIVAGSGIRWDDDEEPDLASARVAFGPLSSPVALWRAYLAGESLAARDMARLPDAFASALRLGRMDEVEGALERVLAETPDLPVAADDPRARLSADVAIAMGPRDSPSAHLWAAKFPGLPDPDAERIDAVVDVDLSWTGARPLGLYAPPGEVLTVEVDPRRANRGIWIAVGDGYDDLRSAPRHAEWRRAPRLERGFPVDAPSIAVSNPYGGPMYLLPPDAAGARGGNLEVTVRGAIPMAVYTLGETDLQAWKRDLERGAPQAILQARGRMRFVVDTSTAAAVEDPAAVLEFWSGFHASHCELAQEPTPRRFESHWIFDPQVGSGFANSTPVAASEHSHEHFVDRVEYPIDGAAEMLSTGSKDGYFTVGHELGHQFQTGDWIGGDLDEVAVNLFPLYTMNGYIHGGGEHETVGFEEDYYDHADLIDFRWDDVGEWEKLELYRQLVLVFGWDAMKRTFASYYLPEYPREEYGGHMDGFAIRFSAVVERDLTGFFAHWEYPLSEDAVAKIRSFGYEAWMPPGWPAAGESGK